MFEITRCPSCGSKKIKKVRKAVRGRFKGRPYTAPNVEFHECPDCGERIYGPEAMRKIEAHRAKPARARVSG